VRCFLGVPITGTLADALIDAGDHIRSADPGWGKQKWVVRPNLHITLHFLGEVPPREIEEVLQALGSVLDQGFEFELTATGLRAAPRATPATMVWATFEDSHHRCASLARRLAAAVNGLEAEHNTKPFRAHATLVRARRPQPLDCDLAAVSRQCGLPGVTVSDRSVTLYESELTPRGPVYSALSTWYSAGRAT
jgi:2'-5' RNA ligase